MTVRPLGKFQWSFEHGNRAGLAITKNRGQVAPADFDKVKSKSSTYDMLMGSGQSLNHSRCKILIIE